MSFTIFSSFLLTNIFKIRLIRASQKLLYIIVSEAVGFSLDRNSIVCNFCEVLTFFICQEKHFNFNYFQIVAYLKKIILTNLTNRNVLFGLANCTTNLLPLYLRTGWSIVSQKTLEGTTKYLIEYKITPRSSFDFK